ncbi:MAG: FAD-dependent oxidoreductase [Hyphomicrobium sp.]|nr:FAD-dependent oxidoreductase [Hyphomicrobium sp.]
MSTQPYDERMYAFGDAPGHYWARTAGDDAAAGSRPLDQDFETDVAIIGGGYTGLSAAHQLASVHGVRAAVLEAGTCPGWGASGRNGGFVAAGGNKLSIGDMIRRVGREETAQYFRSQAEAVTSLQSLIGDSRIDCDVVSDENVCVAHSPHAARELELEARVLVDEFGAEAAYVSGDAFRARYHEGPETFGALVTKPAFAIHPTKLARGLSRLAARAGADVFHGAEVVTWRRDGRGHVLGTRRGVTIRARRAILATNGYMPNALDPRLGYRTVPAISSIIVTQPYDRDDLARRGYRTMSPIYTARHLLAYYRLLPDGRFLFGCRGDTTGSEAAADRHAAVTLSELKRTQPAFHDARIDDYWSGFVSLTARRTLAIGHVPDDPSTVFAFGCHGSGIAAMTWSGRLAADIVQDPGAIGVVPALFRGLPPRLPPFAPLLRWGLRSAYAYYRLNDGVG